MQLKSIRAVLFTLENLSNNGHGSEKLDALIARYEQELTRIYLLDGQPEPEFEPYRNADGILVVNKFGDLETDE